SISDILFIISSFSSHFHNKKRSSYRQSASKLTILLIIAHTTFLFGMYIYHSTRQISQHNIGKRAALFQGSPTSTQIGNTFRAQHFNIFS
ncbi:hypothetical protein, partial [Roseburia hominis]|uniref:hypothetical protein n=1 Tax=Roseburia hominis TaxID=301301 RepID=UPI0039F45CBC